MARGLLGTGSWIATIAPLVVWMGYFILVYAALSIGCAAGYAATDLGGFNVITLTLSAITLAALLAMIVFGWIGYRGWRAGQGADTASERIRFAGAVAMLVAGMSVLSTVWVGLPVLMLAPCQ